MGEVYRAKDTKLKRDVAIKIMPDEFSRDTDRVSRFQREAESLAALNHQNIAAIYDLQESDATRFLILEFVEGDTLADILKIRGALPVDEALQIAKQVCEALEAAHEKGIIHRDLKPANVKITPDGKAKVLDFGLAKAYEAQSASANLSKSPTLSMAATMQGLILGTAAYMSPEQAKGREVDKRADIFAFGAVLYEMLTGRPAFDGDDVGEILARVIEREPDWSTLPSKVPPRIHELLRRCLEKDPKKRKRDAGDLRIDLEQVLKNPEPAAAPGSSRTSPWPWAVAAVAVVALGISLWVPWRSENPADRPLVRLDVDLGADVSLGSAAGTDAIISPDGTRLVYVSQGKLFTRRLDQPRGTELPGTGTSQAPFFSPDGQWVAFFGGGKLKKISVEGGAAVTLCDAPQARGGSWGEDGNIIAALTSAGSVLSRIPASGGTPTPVTELGQGEITHRWPQILPGGKAVLFTVSASLAFDTANVEVVSLADGRRKTLVRGGTFGRYAPSSNGAGHLIYLNRGTLFAVPFNPDALEVRGTPSPVLEQVTYNPGQGDAQVDVSRTGTLLYRSGGAGGLVSVQWLDGAGKTQPLLAKPGVYLRPSLSPDGQRLALTVVEESTDLWVYDWQRDNMTRLTFGGGSSDYALWSPDSRYIVFQSAGGMSWTRADGAAKPQTLTQSRNVQYPWSFAPDGKRLAFIEVSPGTGFDLWTVPVESDSEGLRPGKPEPFLQTPTDERYSAFSPDGRWMVYATSESGIFQIYVRAFPDKGGKWQVSNSGGVYPIWSRDGHELFFESLDNRVMVSTYTVKGDSFVVDKPRVWSDKRLGGIAGSVRGYDLAPDGKRIAALIPVETAEAQKAQNHVIFLENFFDELRRRVPPGK